MLTMIAALATWAAAALWTLDAATEAVAAGSLLLLAGYAFWKSRQGRCPACGFYIRFEPRTELPRTCQGCGVSFSPPRDIQVDGTDR